MAAVATAMLWGDIIFAATPPLLLAATVRTGLIPRDSAVLDWILLNKAFDEVSLPVIKTPSHPKNGEINGKKLPVSVSTLPRAIAIPEKFKT